MWIVFGTKVDTRRVPGGLKVERACDQCGETATFYEKEVTSTFNLYFIPVFDYRRHRVMSCGCCGACYATDELGAQPAHEALEEKVERAAGRLGEYAERAASAVESGISSLLAGERREPPARRQAPAPEPPKHEEEEDDPLADPLESRFRELERKARIRID